MGNKAPRFRELPEDYPFHNTVKIFSNLDYFLEWLTEQYKLAYKIFGTKTFIMRVIGQPTFVMTGNVDNITHILKTNMENYPLGPDRKIRFQGLLGDGIFNSE